MLEQINALTGELYDSVDAISEALVDKEFKEAHAAIDALILKLKHLKSNLVEDEV